MFLTLFTFSFYLPFPFSAIVNAFLSVMIQLRVKKTSIVLTPVFKRYSVIKKIFFTITFNISTGDILLRLFYIHLICHSYLKVGNTDKFKFLYKR